VGRRQSNPKLDAASEAFQRYLKRHGIKFTEPRRRILEAVIDLDEHFEAEQVLFALRERGQRVAKATIYRTLPLLVDCGVLKQIRFDVKQAHYEFCYGEDAHDHMVCRRCGRIVEFASDDVIALREKLAAKHRFHGISHRFQISGLCWECANACPAVLSLQSETDAKDGG
jgi:Fur family transcriptional regulator, ferric uptake regulator